MKKGQIQSPTWKSWFFPWKDQTMIQCISQYILLYTASLFSTLHSQTFSMRNLMPCKSIYYAVRRLTTKPWSPVIECVWLWRHAGLLSRRPSNCKMIGRTALQWRHNGWDIVSNHQPDDCLFNRLFRRRSKKTSKLGVTGLCAGNSLGTGEFPAQMASNAENVSIWWRHHGEMYIAASRLCEIWLEVSDITWGPILLTCITVNFSMDK